MTLEQIKADIMTKVRENNNLIDLSSPSKVALYNIWAYIVAFISFSQYETWRIFQIELDEKIRNQKRYTLLDFRNAALEFRLGHPVDQNYEYSDEGYTDDEIEAAKVVKRSAAVELEVAGRKVLYIKVATEQGDELTALSDIAYEALKQYFARWKPAGTKLVITTGTADDLKLTIDFYYDPLILDQNGVRIDGTENQPVQRAIRAYLKNLEFNGEFNLTELVNRLENVDGCSGEAYVRDAQANFLNPPVFEQITANYVANSGYMDITDANMQINFIPKNRQL